MYLKVKMALQLVVLFFMQKNRKGVFNMTIATILRYTKVEGREPFHERYYLANHLVQIAEKFGIALLPLTATSHLQVASTVCDGLIVPGSTINVNPSYYGEAPFSPQQPVDEYVFDRKVIEAFYRRKKPILGVCGGMQALNVFLGGTLKRDIPNHRRVEHDVSFSSDSFLNEVYGSNCLKVNSFHSQAVDKVAPSLKVAARANDGTIEAIQSKEGSIYGVQWHPETDFSQGKEEGTKIFEYFLAQCAAWKEEEF